MTVSRTLLATALAATALAPAAAQAGPASKHNSLRSAPQMRVLDADTAVLTFTTKRALPRDADGRPQLRIRFAGGQRVPRLRAAGRHGTSRKYTARVHFTTAPRVGAKYTVRFAFRGQATVKRLVKLHPAAR